MSSLTTLILKWKHQAITYCVAFALIIIPAAAVLSGSLADDWFKTLDSNGDGSIDRSEYDNGITKISAYLANTSPDGLSFPGANVGRLLTFPLDLSLEGFWKAFTSSVAMILATEIGDKTFFIAAVLSMKHDRSAVFTGAITALVIMTILSTGMGLVLPRLLPKQYTHILGGLLFLYFGVKLFSESMSMEEGKTSDELEEVEEELLRQPNKKRVDEEEGSTPNRSKTQQQQQTQQKGWIQVVIQSFTLTFLAEWGDRSQIATIALAAAKNPIGVTIGGCIGHATCTGLAVIGGRMLASRISEKTVSKWGGVVFLLFGLHSIFLES
jgi:Ca2+/H+ antiporter, TMEM165/GDT1 family